MSGGERRVVRRLADQILALSADQLTQLNRILREEGHGGVGVGVREPRRPRPPVDAEGVALDAEKGKASGLPPDYWETAQ